MTWCCSQSAGDEMETLQQLLAQSIMAGVCQPVSASDRELFICQLHFAALKYTLRYLYLSSAFPSYVMLYFYSTTSQREIFYFSLHKISFFLSYTSCPAKTMLLQMWGFWMFVINSRFLIVYKMLRIFINYLKTLLNYTENALTHNRAGSLSSWHFRGTWLSPDSNTTNMVHWWIKRVYKVVQIIP